MATSSEGEAITPQYKATELWQKIVEDFRAGMPAKRHRQRMKVLENCFTGSEAVEWLTKYLQNSEMFQSVSKQQAVTLLQKFFECEVIEDAKGKDKEKFSDGNSLYHFVTRPGPLNFLGFTPTKRKREELEEDEKEKGSSSSICLANTYAMLREGEEGGRGEGDVEIDHESTSSLISVTSSSSAIMTGRISLMIPDTERSKIWKDVTLTRLLTILPSLGMLPPANGSVIANNAAADKGRGGGGERSTIEDIPTWIIMAFKCLSKWPTDSIDDVTGGLPIYHGFEQDVFQSISNYFTQQLPHPLIPCSLYELFLSSIYPLIANKDSTATDALQVVCLLIEPSQRIKLHRLLRFMSKAGNNDQLRLSLRISNRELMLERFCLTILRPNDRFVVSPDQRHKIKQITSHMVDHYHIIFRLPSHLRKDVQLELEKVHERKISPQFCQRVSCDEFEEQKSATPAVHLQQLLESIAHDENMSAKLRKQRLKQFKQNYPEIYFQKFPPHPPPEGERSDEDRERRGGKGERRFQRLSNYLQL